MYSPSEISSEGTLLSSRLTLILSRRPDFSRPALDPDVPLDVSVGPAPDVALAASCFFIRSTMLSYAGVRL